MVKSLLLTFSNNIHVHVDVCTYHPGAPVFHDALKVNVLASILFNDLCVRYRVGLVVKRGVLILQIF